MSLSEEYSNLLHRNKNDLTMREGRPFSHDLTNTREGFHASWERCF